MRTATPMTDDQLYRAAPSIFAAEEHHSRSNQYQYIPTIDILNSLREEGFFPMAAQQSHTRDASRRAFTKHLIRLQRAGQAQTGEASEILLINSHDGSSSYQMRAGLYRFVCCNGLVVGDTYGDFRVRHQGDDVRGEIIEGAYSVVEQFDKVLAHREAMRSIQVSADEQRAFANAALALKYDEPDKAPIRSEQLLVPRRQEDRQDDLWTVFNRAQENLTQGGVRGRSASGRRTRTRPIKSIDTDVKLNRALWQLGEEMASLKTGAVA